MICRSSFAASLLASSIAIAFAFSMKPAEASFIYYVEQVGSNVTITGSGSINTTGTATGGIGNPLFPSPAWSYTPRVQGNLIVSGSGQVDSNVWTPLVVNPSPPALSTVSGTVTPSSTSGDVIWFASNNLLVLPQTYISGSPIFTTATYDNMTLADFGWTAGTYATPVINRTYTLVGGQTVQIVGVPEPSQVTLVAGVAAALGAWRLRRLRRNCGETEAAAV
jgi:hypothetical protein